MIQQDIQNKVNELKPYQQRIIQELLNKLLVNNNVDVKGFLKRENICRKCGSKYLVKNGSSKGIKRFKCSDCGSTQAIDANTPLYNLKLKTVWVDFIYLMLSKSTPMTCEAIGEELSINIKTAHAWRHKFLAALNKVNPIKLTNEVELDEVFVPFCVKGRIGKEKYDNYNHNDQSQNTPTALRLDEQQKIANSNNSIFMCVHNRQGDFDFLPLKIQKAGSVSSEIIKNNLQNLDLEGLTIITDEGKPLAKYLRGIENVEHIQFNSKDIKDGKIVDRNIHNNNINNTMNLFKRFSKNFFGYSTKYQWNYMKWFRFVRLFDNLEVKEMAEYSLKDKESHKRFNNIFEYYKEYMIA